MTVNPNRKPTVLLADDHPVILKTAARILARSFNVVAAVQDSIAAVETVECTNPDLVVLDVAMPELNGFQVARELKQRASSAKVAFLTAQEDNAYIAEALSVGAIAYVVKRRMRSDLVPALNLVHAGQFFISPHAFTGTPNGGTNDHVFLWYSNEDAFFQEVSELAYDALSKNHRVLMFLGQRGIGVVGTNLRARGIDLNAAIHFGRYRSFSVENVLPVIMRDGSLGASRVEAFFGHSFMEAAAYSRETGSKMSVFSDITAALLRCGRDGELAVHLEQLWNGIVRAYPCVLYCGCPVQYLASNESRKILLGICGEHCNVIPFRR